MRCPKCRYIGFDAGERCRNCGYEFCLSTTPTPRDLPLRRSDETLGPLADLQLGGPRPARPPKSPGRLASSATRGSEPFSAALDLPLFGGRPPGGDGGGRPATPRPPLSVRRSTPEVPRVKPPTIKRALKAPGLDLPPAAATRRRAQVSTQDPKARPPDLPPGPEPASLGQRLGAALTDMGLMLAVDFTVIYFTLRLCELAMAEFETLPPVPLFLFLLLLNGGYFVAFTVAGGQTIGKMATGIRVIGARDVRLHLQSAVLRTAGYLASALPAGLGFLVVLFGHDRLALHDRLAETRVVKVSLS